jgi:hypothetical protein
MTTKQVNTDNHRSPAGLQTRAAGPSLTRQQRLAVNVLAVAGSALLVYSAVIHFHLWDSEGYRHIPTIGPLFLAQAIVGVVLGLATGIRRTLLLVVAAAGLSVSSVGALLISTWWGLFGWQESFGAPYVGQALWVEGIASLLLGTAALLLALPWLSRLRSRRA